MIFFTCFHTDWTTIKIYSLIHLLSCLSNFPSSYPGFTSLKDLKSGQINTVMSSIRFNVMLRPEGLWAGYWRSRFVEVGVASVPAQRSLNLLLWGRRERPVLEESNGPVKVLYFAESAISQTSKLNLFEHLDLLYHCLWYWFSTSDQIRNIMWHTTWISSLFYIKQLLADLDSFLKQPLIVLHDSSKFLVFENVGIEHL